MAGPFVVSRNGAVIGAPPQMVFDYLADMARYGEWNPEPHFEVTARPEGPPRVGSAYCRERTGETQGPLAIRPGPGPASQVTEVKITTIAVYQPHRNLVLETSDSYNGLLYSVERASFELQPTPEGAWVTMVSEVEVMVPSAFIGPVYAIRLARAAFQRLLGRRFSGLFSSMPPGPYLSRIKEMMETGKITRRI